MFYPPQVNPRVANGVLNDDTLFLFSGKTSGRVRPYGTVRVKIPCYIPRTGSKRCWLTRCPAVITASGCKPLRLKPSTKLGETVVKELFKKGSVSSYYATTEPMLLCRPDEAPSRGRLGTLGVRLQ